MPVKTMNHGQCFRGANGPIGVGVEFGEQLDHARICLRIRGSLEFGGGKCSVAVSVVAFDQEIETPRLPGEIRSADDPVVGSIVVLEKVFEPASGLLGIDRERFLRGDHPVRVRVEFFEECRLPGGDFRCRGRRGFFDRDMRALIRRSDGQVHLSTVTENGSAIVTIRDNGQGIAEGDLPHIFDRFYRTDLARSRASGRSGLGLPICKAIVETHGGKIEATSTVGDGTTFTVRFPAK